MRLLVAIIFTVLSTVSFAQDRSDEIWDMVDNRIIRELDEEFENGDFPLAISLLKVQFAYSPKDYETLTSLGWMLENVERYDEAETYYVGFRAENPGDAEAAYPLGWFYFMKRRYDDCIRILEPTILSKPSPHRNTFVALAKSYERQKKYKDAIRVWEVQIKIYPEDLAAKANIERVKNKIAAGG